MRFANTRIEYVVLQMQKPITHVFSKAICMRRSVLSAVKAISFILKDFRCNMVLNGFLVGQLFTSYVKHSLSLDECSEGVSSFHSGL